MDKMSKQYVLKKMVVRVRGECEDDSRIGYIASLDGLRGITICMIAFLWHFWMFQAENGYPFEKIFMAIWAWKYFL